MNWIKSKISGIIIVFLLTIAGGLYLNNKNNNELIVKLQSDYQTQHDLAQRLDSENKKLNEELSKRPDQAVKIVKDVYEHICKAESAEERILNAPTVKRITNVESTKKEYVDVDAPFDPDFLRLLE